MSTPSGSRTAFWRGAIAGLLLSAAGAAGFGALSPWLGAAAALRIVAAALALSYLLLLMHDHGARVGRLVTLAGWAGLTAALAAIDAGIAPWLLAQTGVIWLVRCLYAHDSLRAAALDGALSALALCAAVSTALHTQSVLLSAWTFFLLQALHGVIPAGAAVAPDSPPDAETFDQAWRTADAALRRLSARPHSPTHAPTR